jgi:hypothetical protein
MRVDKIKLVTIVDFVETTRAATLIAMIKPLDED